MPKNLIRFIVAGGITLTLSVLPMAAQTDVYLFGGQSNMNPEIVNGFRAEMALLDPGATLWTPRYRNPGIGLDSGWSGNTWHGDPPAPGRGNFYGGTGPSDPNIGNAYSAMLSAWQNSMSNISGPYAIKGIIWVQGEQDSKNSISANRYAANLDNLIARIHEDLGLAQGSVQFYYTSMESWNFTYRNALHAQQVAADKNSGDPLSIANANRVDASGLSYTDGVHYTTASRTELGQRLANIISPDPTIPPVPPAGLASTSGDGQVSLNWDDNTDVDFASYTVYRSTTSGNYSTALVADLEQSDYVDSSAVNNTVYYYVVTATDTDGNESALSSEVIGVPAGLSNQSPAFTADPIIETVATEGAAYSGTIADHASDPESDPLFFSRVSGPDWLSVAADGSLSGTPALSDAGVNAFTVDVLAAGGSDTATLQITVNMNPLEPPVAPTGLGVTAGDQVVTLDWDDNSEPDLASYSVYRSTILGSPGTALASGLSTSDFTDSTVTNDITYYYSVTAIDEDGNESDPSDELDATPVKSVSSYQNDFSSAPTIENESGNTSPWINNNVSMPPAGQYTFIEGFASLTHDAVDNDLDKSGNANVWFLINTSTWEPGDYTVTFDGRVSSGTMSWDVIGGNASGSGTGLRLWMNKGAPYLRAASSGTAERLGQINEAGDTAGSATASVAAGSYTNTSMASQSLNITLTDAHVGSPNDYILIGWAGASGSIDNISIAPASAAVSYTDWISGYDVDGLTAFTDDSDNDDLPNGIESYFGTHPGAFNVGVTPSAVDTDTGTFTFTHPISETPAADITAAYRWSKDLSTGFHADGATSEGTTVTFDQGTPINGEVTVTATIEGTTAERIFVDIEVLRN